jgi:hypothetical protein
MNGAKISKIWGNLLPRRGYRILARGFNPGNRPPGRRALKGHQVIVISNRREKHISIRPAIVQLCTGAKGISPTPSLALSGRTALLDVSQG